MSREYELKNVFVNARGCEDDMYSVVAGKNVDYYTKLMCNDRKRNWEMCARKSVSNYSGNQAFF